MDTVSIPRLADLHPLLSKKVYAMDEALAPQGIIIRVTQGLRTVAQQDALYAQGRSLPGKIVTNAKGGYSAHNFGYAVDLIPGLRSVDNWTPNWNSSSDDFKIMAKAGIDQGLVWGGAWHSIIDPPHFQLLDFPVTPTDSMRIAYKKGGLQAVWNLYPQGD